MKIGRLICLVVWAAAMSACNGSSTPATDGGDAMDTVDHGGADETSSDADAAPDELPDGEAGDTTGDAGDATDAADATDATDTSDDGGGCVDTGETFDLTGTFAVEAKINLNAIVSVQTKQYFVVTITQTGTTIAQSSHVCDLSLPTIPGMVEIAVPTALENVIRSITQVDSGTFLDGTTACAGYEPPDQLVLLGASLDHPMTDPLPTAADLTHALDQDSDSHPGVTTDVTVSALCGTTVVGLYAALRSIVSLHGVVADSNTVDGPVDPTFDFSVLGYSDSCLSTADSLVIVADPGSSFRMRRVDGQNGAPDLDTNTDGTVDCDELAAGVATIFP